MIGLNFTIQFNFEVIPDSMRLELCARVEMITNNKFIVTDIRRANTAETPLLPPMTLLQTEGGWMHENRPERSRIGSAIGDQIEKYLAQLAKTNLGGVVS
jgi:hypothetical protein